METTSALEANIVFGLANDEAGVPKFGLEGVELLA